LPRPAWPTILLSYASCHCWDERQTLPCLAFFHWDEGLINFCLISISSVAWIGVAYGGCVPSHPTIGWYGVLLHFAQAVLEPWSFWSQPSKQLGL
jgi:hypothetical protein